MWLVLGNATTLRMKDRLRKGTESCLPRRDVFSESLAAAAAGGWDGRGAVKVTGEIPSAGDAGERNVGLRGCGGLGEGRSCVPGSFQQVRGDGMTG